MPLPLLVTIVALDTTITLYKYYYYIYRRNKYRKIICILKEGVKYDRKSFA